MKTQTGKIGLLSGLEFALGTALIAAITHLGIALWPINPLIATITYNIETWRLKNYGHHIKPTSEKTKIWIFQRHKNPKHFQIWVLNCAFATTQIFILTLSITGMALAAYIAFHYHTPKILLPITATAITATIISWAILGKTHLQLLLQLTQNRPNWAQEVQEITSSRRRIVEAFEIERRRIEGDLHDGTQQHLVATRMALGEAALILQTNPNPNPADLTNLINKAQESSATALNALRETVHGVHPRLLTDYGLKAAVHEIAQSFTFPVTIKIPIPLPPLPDGVTSTAYYVISEALTNCAKYAQTKSKPLKVSVLIATGANLNISIVDTGQGGATIKPGHGLAGLTDRLKAFGGHLKVDSPPGGPTTVAATIPILLPGGKPALPTPKPHK